MGPETQRPGGGIDREDKGSDAEAGTGNRHKHGMDK